MLSYVNISHFQDYSTPNTQLQRFGRIKPTPPWSTDYFWLRIKQLHNFQSSCSRKKKPHLTFFLHPLWNRKLLQTPRVPWSLLSKMWALWKLICWFNITHHSSCWVGSALVPLSVQLATNVGPKNTSTEIPKALGALFSAPWSELG